MPTPIEDFHGCRNFNGHIGNEKNESVVHGILEHRSVLEPQPNARRRLVTCPYHPPTTGEPAIWPTPGTEVDPRMIARWIRATASGHPGNIPFAGAVSVYPYKVSAALSALGPKLDSVKLPCTECSRLEEANRAWVSFSTPARPKLR